ncbi:hypothetical protein Y032_0099g3185 [Ancylostoma ceylanicum]|uniref:SCP domain-containing protein n=1 Tax=Ancylostoma ceylanicum TaxID=53326 RepID=A0A016TJ48_9BILA|nr:hypothetical protein Y032_0099g3185 [Ancylostoma ceylanicum]
MLFELARGLITGIGCAQTTCSHNGPNSATKHATLCLMNKPPLGVDDVIYEIDKHVGCQSDAECPYPLVCDKEYGDCASSWQPDTSA